ncbi:MAG: hypothetical protein R2701_05855 [Acidimicrobiales bacterium]
MTVYVAEEFSESEADVLRRYFTNLDSPVFALVNLPEVVKNALRPLLALAQEPPAALFLDEFVGGSTSPGTRRSTPRWGSRWAEELTTGSSSSTATTRWPSSAGCTWPASRRRTC